MLKESKSLNNRNRNGNIRCTDTRIQQMNITPDFAYLYTITVFNLEGAIGPPLIGKAALGPVGHLYTDLNGEILGRVLFSSEIK